MLSIKNCCAKKIVRMGGGGVGGISLWQILNNYQLQCKNSAITFKISFLQYWFSNDSAAEFVCQEDYCKMRVSVFL